MEVIDLIIRKNSELFGSNPNVEKINVGFTNTIYCVNDAFIVKLCTNLGNEENFKKEIEFYNSNRENPLIPKLYYSSVEKGEIPYYYEIIEKVKGVSLYNVWHTLSSEQREEIIKQICMAMKEIHSNTASPYDWADYFKKQISLLYSEAKENNIFNKEECDLIEQAYSKFEHFLKSEDFVLVHNDLHFDNIFYNDGEIKLIDFERAMFAPKDFELDIFFRMVRKPWKYASEETERFTNASDYANIEAYVHEYYPELVNVPFLAQRLAIYDIVYNLEQLVENPDEEELKEDIINAAKLVALKRV